MRLEFHRLTSWPLDVLRGRRRTQLAEEFYSELRQFFQNAANNPEAHSIRERDLRRVNLERFPYHFLFRIVNDCVRVLVVRHHSRRPTLGIDRR